jgi:LEA14-like dessication related protein
VNFSASVGVHNPASLGFTLREINLKTSIEGHYIGTLTHNRPLHISARSDSSYHMNFSLELTNMLTGASMLYGLAKKSKVALDLQGYVKTRSFLIPKKTGIQENRVVDIPSNFR